MEDKDLLLSRIANHQLMFGSFNTDSSIVYGRMGLVLFFFHYARYTENTLFEDFGGEILDEIFDDMHTEINLYQVILMKFFLISIRRLWRRI